VVEWLAMRQVTPNQVTLAALGLSILAALCIGAGWLRLGALVLIVAGLGDLVDGMLARATDQTSPFGAFFDSTLDRISEGAVLAAVAYRFASDGQPLLVALVVLALLGSLLVSYARARAEALGIDCKVGLMSRAERLVLLIAGLLLGLLGPAIVLIAVLSLYTVGQRMQHVREALVAGD
jgi:CDP-diacylglycerol--glycerol-3-phosphate 3-phosphatidyltransferase